jgi:single-strand DNA-binding protein
MNIITVTGRLTANPTIRTSDDGSVRGFFTIAVDRPVKKDEEGKQPTDFPSFVAFRKTAEVLRDYAVKGQFLVIQGHIATSTYDKDGVRQYSTELVADRIQLGAKPRNTSAPDTGDTGDEYSEHPADEFEGANL